MRQIFSLSLPFLKHLLSAFHAYLYHRQLAFCYNTTVFLSLHISLRSITILSNRCNVLYYCRELTSANVLLLVWRAFWHLLQTVRTHCHVWCVCQESDTVPHLPSKQCMAHYVYTLPHTKCMHSRHDRDMNIFTVICPMCESYVDSLTYRMMCWRR